VKHIIGNVDEFPLGVGRIVEVAGREIGVYHLAEGFFAVLNICPHMHAPVCRGQLGGTYLPSKPYEMEYGLRGRVLRCPWHGWEFDVVTGQSLFGIDKRRLKSFAVDVVDGQVVLEAAPIAAAS